MSEKVSVKGLDPADVLAALYNASQPLGMGMLHFDPNLMTREEARLLLTDIYVRSEATNRDETMLMLPKDDRGVYFDYLKGRVMKVRIGGEELDPYLYDRDNGKGAAARAIQKLREGA